MSDTVTDTFYAVYCCILLPLSGVKMHLSYLQFS